jgi:LPXTG-motif cell wall-anchored protein
MTRRWSGSLRGISVLLLSGALLTASAVTALAQAAQTFNVVLTNFNIGGAPGQVRAGTPLVFNATSSGLPHNLAIDGNGVDLRPSTPNLMDGQSGQISFPALQPGTYNLYCPVGQHRANGMETRLVVVSSLPTAGGQMRLPATGGLSLPAGLALAGLASGVAGVFLRRRKA